MNETRINLADYEVAGAGALGESYISKKDPNILLKLYSREREQMGLDEYERACKVYSIGVPCPAPGELVRTGEGQLGLQFRRIVGKKSYARALSEHPERLEEYAKRLVQTVTPSCRCIVVGLSFGGMLAPYIAKEIQAERCILLSSVKSGKEFPRWYRLGYPLFVYFTWIAYVLILLSKLAALIALFETAN